MTPNAISKLMNPRSVAVIGASADPSKTAGRPVAYLQKHGYAGKIFPVNPRVQMLGDLPCYPSIAALPEVPDVAVVLLGSDRAETAVRELAALGAGAAIVLASGYTESGAAGAAQQAALKAAAGSMRILGPNTIGLVNITDSITLSPSSALEMDHFPLGGLGVVSQSGGVLGSLLSRAAARGIGLSKLISTSNEADLELSDFIHFLADDLATLVIALYIESVRHPDKFRAAVQHARQNGKPVVAYKIGRSEAGIKAAASHTGSLAGTDRMYDAFFAQIGVIRAQTFSDLLDIPAALATGRKLRGQRVAILTSTGGAGTLVSDSLGLAGFATPTPDGPTAERLLALLPGVGAVLDRNPIDVTLAGLQPQVLRGAIQALLDSPSYDALVLIVGSSGLAMPELMAAAIQACLPSSDKPVLAYVSPQAPRVIEVLTQSGVPAFFAPECVASALQALWAVATPPPSAAQPEAAATTPIQPPPDLPSGTLNEVQAMALLRHYGIPCPAAEVVYNAEQAVAAAQRLGEPVALKLLSAAITHKSDVGGVALNLTAAQLPQRLARMATDVQAHTGHAPPAYVVQTMVRPGVEMILGMTRDPLGSALLVGMGGITAELFKDTSVRLLLPGEALTPAQALHLLQSLKTWPLLNGYRGQPQADVPALVQAMVNFTVLLAQLGDALETAEINPLFVLPQGQGVCAADGVVVLRAA